MVIAIFLFAMLALAAASAGQRQQYKLKNEERESCISRARIQRLERLGFLWTTPPRKGRAAFVGWKTRFQQLWEYRLENGDTLIPQKYLGNPALGKWVQ